MSTKYKIHIVKNEKKDYVYSLQSKYVIQVMWIHSNVSEVVKLHPDFRKTKYQRMTPWWLQLQAQDLFLIFCLSELSLPAGIL